MKAAPAETGAATKIASLKSIPAGVASDGDDLALARALVDHGIPVVVCPPNPRWRKGDKGRDVLHPWGWAVITAEESRAKLADYRPGIDTLAAVAGHGL